MIFTEFIGRLHPLLVHLPIGILLFAVVLMLFQRFRSTDLSAAIDLSWLLGAVSAAAVCVAGWFLAQSGEYDADMVFRHQWTGIATAVLGFGAYFFKKMRPILAIATTVVLTVAGHFGGTLTHGEDYLFPKKKTPSVTEPKVADSLQTIANQSLTTTIDTSNNSQNPTLNTQHTFVYRDLIVPILEKKCYSCHSATKKKGGLRLDTEGSILAGGEHGKVLSVGNPEASKLFANLLLPEDDDDHMPPKGKPQLTQREIEVIHYWIKKGASFKEIEETMEATAANSVATNGLVIPSLPKNQTTQHTTRKTQHAKENLENQILAQKIEPATPSVLTALKQQNVSLTDFGGGSNYLMANFINVKNYNSALIDGLKPIENQLVRVKLSNQPVSDADIQKLSSFKKITRLSLEKTNITDAALTNLKNLPNLEQLNLYGTKITDKGLAELARCPNLKSIYLWQTQTTAAGIEALKKALPNAQIEVGGFQFSKTDSVRQEPSK